MRTYSVAIAALAVDSPLKWLDNLLSQHLIEEVVSESRGRSRRISHEALRRIALIRVLHLELGASVGMAVSLSRELAAGAEVRHGAVTLRVDVVAIRRELDRRLADALESAPIPRRGRPPRTG